MGPQVLLNMHVDFNITLGASESLYVMPGVVFRQEGISEARVPAFLYGKFTAAAAANPASWDLKASAGIQTFAQTPSDIVPVSDNNYRRYGPGEMTFEFIKTNALQAYPIVRACGLANLDAMPQHITPDEVNTAEHKTAYAPPLHETRFAPEGAGKIEPTYLSTVQPPANGAMRNFPVSTGSHARILIPPSVDASGVFQRLKTDPIGPTTWDMSYAHYMGFHALQNGYMEIHNPSDEHALTVQMQCFRQVFVTPTEQAVAGGTETCYIHRHQVPTNLVSVAANASVGNSMQEVIHTSHVESVSHPLASNLPARELHRTLTANTNLHTSRALTSRHTHPTFMDKAVGTVKKVAGVVSDVAHGVSTAFKAGEKLLGKSKIGRDILEGGAAAGDRQHSR